MKKFNTLIIQRDGSTFFKNWRLKKKTFFLHSSYNNNLYWKIQKKQTYKKSN
jgi:hypothetical protein